MDRRSFFVSTSTVAALAATQADAAGPVLARHANGWVSGHLSGARMIAETLKAEHCGCVYGIPGAQENELWDELKARHIPYLLVAHEYSAACMADAYARTVGQPGVLCVVPGPGVTNALTGLGEALLDSSPIVAIVGDVASGDKYRPFQVHSLNNVDLLKPVTKCVIAVTDVKQIPHAIRQAFQKAMEGEPGPVAVVIPFQMLIETADVNSPPLAVAGTPFDAMGFEKALQILRNPNLRVGIYAGLGCMDYGESLGKLAEVLQAPVATSVSGRGCLPDDHPWSVGWGFGPHAGEVAEVAFAPQKLHPLKTGVNCLLAIGVKFSEVSTGFYGNPMPKTVIHVDAHAPNLGAAVKADVCVQADAGAFITKLCEHAEAIRKPNIANLLQRIHQAKCDRAKVLANVTANPCGIDPVAVIAAFNKHLPCGTLVFTDVSASEHFAAEFCQVTAPRTYFNPVDNQSMGWSIPAAIGAQRVHGNKCVATLTGDGCFLMSAMELTTAARAGLPVKFFILDDHAYHYMQILQKPAYKRTTATALARIDYRSLAHGFGLGYVDIAHHNQLDDGMKAAMAWQGPVLVRVQTDYGTRKIRWVEAVRAKYSKELTAGQKARFVARIGARGITGAEKTSD